MKLKSIIQEIKQETSRFTSEEQKENLIKIVSYISSLYNKNNIQPLILSFKNIKEIIGDDKKAFNAFIDALFFLCGTKWGILEPVYHYSYYDKDTMYHHLIELTEDEIPEANETGLLNNQELKKLFNNNTVRYNPKEIDITLRLNQSWIND